MKLTILTGGLCFSLIPSVLLLPLLFLLLSRLYREIDYVQGVEHLPLLTFRL